MMLNNSSFKIFVDFDGTISTTDVGEAMFQYFGEKEQSIIIVNDWVEQKINSSQLWKLLCGTVHNFDEIKFDEFLNTISIDQTFRPFIRFCKSERFEVKVLSDGFDYYINKILKRENLMDLEVFSNKLIVDRNNISPEFPYTDEECTRCANCKRNHVLNFSSEEDFTIYIGDGFTDICPAQHCDFIFAKDSLLKYCEINRITYFPYSNFNDVLNKLTELKSKKRLNKRHQAELKRKEVFKQG
jgi:2-hydroxy-3-keto-5-methylthiopentenyl-1-phosphate phosphatase